MRGKHLCELRICKKVNFFITVITAERIGKVNHIRKPAGIVVSTVLIAHTIARYVLNKCFHNV